VSERPWYFKHGTNANASAKVREYMGNTPEGRKARRWMGQKKPRRSPRSCSMPRFMDPGNRFCKFVRPCKAMTRANDGRWWLCWGKYAV
jgi:hypothetical protein